MAILKSVKSREEVQTMYGDRNPWTLVAGMKISKDFMGSAIEDPKKKQLKIEDYMKLQPHYWVFSLREGNQHARDICTPRPCQHCLK